MITPKNRNSSASLILSFLVLILMVFFLFVWFVFRRNYCKCYFRVLDIFRERLLALIKSLILVSLKFTIPSSSLILFPGIQNVPDNEGNLYAEVTEWLCFQGTEETLSCVLDLRQKWFAQFLCLLQHPEEPTDEVKNNVFLVQHFLQLFFIFQEVLLNLLVKLHSDRNQFSRKPRMKKTHNKPRQQQYYRKNWGAW